MLGKINASSLPAAQQGALHQMLARALEKSGDSGRALAELGKAAAASPNDANVQYQYGAAALNAGDTRTAVSALEKAARLDSGDAMKQKAYSQALLRLGRETRGAGKTQIYESAAAAAQKAVAADASYDNLMLLAGAQLGAKQYDGALATLKNAAAKNSADWLPLFYQGQAFTQKQQFQSAESALKSALNKASASKDKVTIWKQLGFVYEKSKKYDSAIAAYNQASDSASVARVQKNKETDEFNLSVEEENQRNKELEEEAAKIKEQLEQLPGGPPPGS
jgi:tetratricopeptide (TPR) repeat protein